MHFERQKPFTFQNALNYILFPEKKIIKKMCVPTLPKIFKPVTRNTLIFLFGLMVKIQKKMNTFLFLFSYKILVIRAEIHKMLV